MNIPLLDLLLAQLEQAQAIKHFQVEGISIDEKLKMSFVEEIASYVTAATGEAKDWDGVVIKSEVNIEVPSLAVYGIPVTFVNNKKRAKSCPFETVMVGPFSIKLRRISTD